MENNSSSGLGLGMVLFTVFLILKMTGNIDWSWWWVYSPLWISSIVGILYIVIFKGGGRAIGRAAKNLVRGTIKIVPNWLASRRNLKELMNEE